MDSIVTNFKWIRTNRTGKIIRNLQKAEFIILSNDECEEACDTEMYKKICVIPESGKNSHELVRAYRK